MKIKVMWICAQPPNEIANEFSLKPTYLGGWLEGIFNELQNQENLSLMYAFPYKDNKSKKIIKNNVEYVGLDTGTNKVDSYKDVLNKFNPDIIHVFGTENSFVNNLILSTDTNRVILSIQGILGEIHKNYSADVLKYNYLHFPKNVLFLLLNSLNKSIMKSRAKDETRVLRYVQHVIGRTAFDKDYVNRYFPNIQYHLCNEILRKEFYTNKVWNDGLAIRHQIYLSQGNYPIKGLHILLQAISKLIDEFPDLMLLIGGDNLMKNTAITHKLGFSYSNFIKKIIEKKRLQKNIRFLGFQSSNQVVSNLLSSQLFVLPSSIENSPNSLGEAMILGVPSICSDVGGIPSLTNAPYDSLLYPFESPEELSANIKKIFTNKDLRILMSKNSRNTAMRIYDRENNSKKLIEIYKNI